LNLMVPVFALALVAAAAQSSAKPGCASIPYPDVSQECSRRQAEADTLCKRDAWECVGLDTKPLRSDVAALSGKLEGVKTEQDEMRRQESEAGDDKSENLQLKIGDLEGVIVQSSVDLLAAEQTLEARLAQIDLRITNGRQCRDALIAVRDAFKAATRQARFDPEAASKPANGPLIEQWAKAREEKDKAIEKVVGGLDQCEKQRAGEAGD